jgi:hypothetical protein
MTKSTFIHAATFVAVGLIVVAASNVMSSPLNSQATATAKNTPSPMAIYARNVAHEMRRAETGVLLVEDR